MTAGRQDPKQSHVLAFSWIRPFSGCDCHQIHFTQQWGWTCFKMTSQLSPDRSNLGSQELIWAVHNCQPVICLRNVFARPSFTPTKTDVFKCAVLNWKCSTLLSTLGLFCLPGGVTQVRLPVLHQLLTVLWSRKKWQCLFLSLFFHPGDPRISRKAANTKWNLQLVHTNVCIF